MSLIRVLKIEPTKKPEVVIIENSLESLQHEVNGPIQSISIGNEVEIICNENGKFFMQPNRELRDSEGHIYDIIYGTFIIVGSWDGDDDRLDEWYDFCFSSLTDEEVKRYSEQFKYPRESFHIIDDQILVYEIDDVLGMIFPLDAEGHRKGG